MPELSAADLLRLRLDRHGIAAPRFDAAAEVVAWLGAMQAQDYYGSLWAVGLRMRSAVEADVERAIADGRLVRTWPMRGTLHLIASRDVRWMLPLTAARSIAGNAARLHRDYGLDETELRRCRKLVEKTLRDGAVLRGDLYAALERAGIATSGQRGVNITGRLAQEGLICGGPRMGKQPSFVLFDAWVPAAPHIPREEALAELAWRYFRARGPATAQDFAWWSGLTVKDAQAGVAMIADRLAQDSYEGRPHWRARESEPASLAKAGRRQFLLPPFDEYLVSYKDRSAAVDPASNRLVIGINGLVNASVVADGRVAALWKRALDRHGATLTLQALRALRKTELDGVRGAARDYARFLGMKVALA
ncbi:winged helix DNA-binding domain-containing protein [Luteimonas aquatica]|uniref:winged helix DNA-binding domain-containing protein n=1 Tax=Luteimonas aquatica TaxID=450364 RepID=UPI001F5A6F74|nr:winged helix DNA-binding domain-containing protein [Luteimonas aquatica]